MQITCPDCSARYLVKPEAIGEQGRRVKCTRCKSVWFQEPVREQKPKPEVAPEPEAVEPIPKGGNVPAIKKEKAPLVHKLAFAASFFIFFLTLFYVTGSSVLPHASWLSGLYRVVGIYDTAGVGIGGVSLEQQQEGDKLKLMLTGAFLNTTDQTKVMPMLRVAVYNQNEKALVEAMLIPPQQTIAAGEAVDFYNVIPSVSPNAATVVLDVGDPHSLKQR